MANPEHIEHQGRVESIDANLVRVKIVANSACSSCASRKACGMSESEEKIIEVKTRSAAEFSVGEEVKVAVRRKVGLWAVAVAYVAPLAVLIAVLVTTSLLGVDEGIAALGSIGGVAIYYLLLWFFGGKVGEKVNFTISKL
jgi:sigma-E factor negative regulatory protein RseC